MNSVLVGAGISLFTAIITAWVAFYFQFVNEARKRKWQIEDANRVELISIRKKRFSNVEEFLNKVALVCIYCAEAEDKVLIAYEKSSLNEEHKKRNFEIWREPIADAVKDYMKSLHDIFAFGTKDVGAKLVAYMALLTRELDFYDKLCKESISSEGIDVAKERNRISNFMIESQKVRGDVIIALDKALFE